MAPIPSPVSLTPDPPDETELFPPLPSLSPLSSSSSIPPPIPYAQTPSFAQRFKDSLRNLRKLSYPSSEIDGVPVVIAPNSVVLQASESWKDHIIAHFHGRCPGPAKIYNDLNPVWGKHGNITIHTLSETACLIFVPSVATRQWVVDVGYWQVDNCALTVALWSPEASLEMKELVTAPTLVVLKSVPPQLYSLDGLSVIASGIGEPLHTEHSRLAPFHFGDTKVKVEIKLESLPPPAVIIRDTRGYSVRVSVDYPRLPPKCCNCGKFGHSLKYCTLPIQRKNFKHNQVTLRVSSAASQVIVKDKDIKLSVDGDSGLEDTAPSSTSGPLEIVDSAPSPVTTVVTQKDVPVGKEKKPYAKAPLTVAYPQNRSTGFPPFTGKPSLRFLTHRLDRNKKLKIQLPSNPIEVSTTPIQVKFSLPLASEVREDLLEDRGGELEEGEIPFLPSPASVKKAKKQKRLEAKVAASGPSQAVSQMFSSIRGNALGRKPPRF